jgi:hypothetical protein
MRAICLANLILIDLMTIIHIHPEDSNCSLPKRWTTVKIRRGLTTKAEVTLTLVSLREEYNL